MSLAGRAIFYLHELRHFAKNRISVNYSTKFFYVQVTLDRSRRIFSCSCSRRAL
jgi:hypothetical protein